MTRRYQPL